MRFEIFEGNIDRVRRSLGRIINKAARFGCSVHYDEVGEVFREIPDGNDEKGKPRFVLARFVVVEAEGEAVINGWELIAEVEHTKNGNILRSFGDTGVEVPERYYDSDPFCEHCGTKRRRNNTYIVRNTETGEFKQVGKSCLKDFTRGWSAEAVAQYYAFFDELIEGEAPGAGRNYGHYFERDVYLRFAAETIIKFGYHKRNWETHDSGTAGDALEYMDFKLGRFYWMPKEVLRAIEKKLDDVGFDENDEKAVKMVNDALEWLKSQDASNNYMHNLKVACALDYCEGKHVGILCSLFPTYDRELEYQARIGAERKKNEEAAKISKWVGSVGDRIKIKITDWRCLTSWETQFGETYVYKLVDADGNVYTWKTTKWLDDEIEELDITGTVKEHKVYRDVKQTELTRCRVA